MDRYEAELKTGQRVWLNIKAESIEDATEKAKEMIRRGQWCGDAIDLPTELVSVKIDD